MNICIDHITDSTKATEIEWSSERYDTYEFVALNLDCTNTSSEETGSGSGSGSAAANITKIFSFTVNGTFLNTKEAHPQLSIEYMHFPEIFLCAIVWTILMASIDIAFIFFMFKRAKSKRSTCGDFLHSENRLRYLFMFNIAILLTFVGCILSYSYWNSFADSGLENRYTLYFGKLFLSASNAIVMFVLYLWVRGTDTVEMHYTVAVGALVCIAALFFEFYRTTDPGWSTAVLIFTVVALYANPLLNMIEAHIRCKISGVGPSSKHERTSLINNSEERMSDEEDDDEEEDFKNEFRSIETRKRFDGEKLFSKLSSNFDAMVPTPTWVPWAVVILIIGVVQGFWALLPDVLPWYFKWLQFQPYGLAGICVGLSVMIMEHTAARPPPPQVPSPSDSASSNGSGDSVENREGNGDINVGRDENEVVISADGDDDGGKAEMK